MRSFRAHHLSRDAHYRRHGETRHLLFIGTQALKHRLHELWLEYLLSLADVRTRIRQSHERYSCVIFAAVARDVSIAFKAINGERNRRMGKSHVFRELPDASCAHAIEVPDGEVCVLTHSRISALTELL